MEDWTNNVRYLFSMAKSLKNVEIMVMSNHLFLPSLNNFNSPNYAE
jgi:hypothetical protein